MSKNLRDKTVLVTGGAGYIGSVLVRQLLQSGYKVRVVDILRSGGESLLEVAQHPSFSFYKVDIRDKDAMRNIIKGCWAVAHLAAIVGDPACKAEPDLAVSINLEGSQQLYALAESAGCERFVFASTCSNYGKMTGTNEFVCETSLLAPVSLYAETKVGFEKFLLGQSKSNKCKPTCLRFSTVYGFSPRIRFDLTVNEFVKELKLGRELVIFGEQFWRPYCHVEDLARSIGTVLAADSDKVAFDVYNVGDTSENYTKQMLVNAIQAKIPSASIKYVQKNEDPRDYRVNFDKIAGELNFVITKRVADGIDEVIRLIDMELINNPDDQKYYNI